ncbi:energy-coupling factor ABC transporter substrate-binding protein [Thermosynechococcaceae cyanobacterium Okahandja]
MAKFIHRPQVWLLLAAVVLLTGVPLLFGQGKFEGADAQAEEMISELSPEYEPWAQPFFEPQSSEVESLLFALQAALGAGVIGFVVGKYTERQRQTMTQAPPSDNP